MLQHAEGLRLSYRFKEAGAIFSTIAKETQDSVLRGKAEQLLLLCENGQVMLRYIETPRVTGKITVPKQSFFNYYDINFGGRWAQTPADLLFAAGTSDTLSPVFMEEGSPSVLYFSAQLSGNWDIYVIRRTSDSQWTAPEPLNNINTAFDERFPYVTPDGKTMYFSSNGHSGMGGYDLFRSVFNADTQQWGVPENLGFPYSSPYDDWLFVPAVDQSVALFASSRDGRPDSLSVYRIAMEANPVKQAGRTVPEIQQLAKLEPLQNKEEEVVDMTAPLETSESTYQALHKVLLQQSLTEQLVQDDLKAIRRMYALVDDEQERAAILEKIKEYEEGLIQMQERIRQTTERIHQTEQSLLEQGIVPELQPVAVEAICAPMLLTPFLPRYTPSVPFPTITILPVAPEEPAEEADLTFRVTDRPAVYNDPAAVEGLIYRIQIGSFSRRLPADELNGLSPVFIQAERNLFVHYVGQFTTYAEVAKVLPEVKKRGFRGAVVVGMLHGKKVAVKVARDYELKRKRTPPKPAPATAAKASYNVVLGEYPGGLPAPMRQAVQQHTNKDIIKTSRKGRQVFIVGPFTSEAEAKSLQAQLRAKGFTVTID